MDKRAVDHLRKQIRHRIAGSWGVWSCLRFQGCVSQLPLRTSVITQSDVLSNFFDLASFAFYPKAFKSNYGLRCISNSRQLRRETIKEAYILSITQALDWNNNANLLHMIRPPLIEVRSLWGIVGKHPPHVGQSLRV